MAIDRYGRNRGSFMPLSEAMNRLFEGSFIAPSLFMGGVGTGAFPPADMHVTDNDVIIHMAIPGANPDDINVSVTGDTVSVSGEIGQHFQSGQSGQSGGQQGQTSTSQGQTGSQQSGQSQSSSGQGRRQQSQPYFSEIFQGQFQRVFTLPVEVDPSKASATFENGVLTLTLPKSEAIKPRRIQVGQGNVIQGQSTSQSQSSQGQSGQTQTETVPVQQGNTGSSSNATAQSGAGSSTGGSGSTGSSGS